MLEQTPSRAAGILLGVVSVVVMLAAYTLLAEHQHRINPEDTTIPTWGQIGDGIQKMLMPHPRTGERWLAVDAWASFGRLFLGLAYGVLGGFVVGLLMGCSRPIEALLTPPVTLLAKIPPTAALAVFFVLTKSEMQLYVAMIAFGVLPSLAQTTYLAVKDVPEELIFKAYTLGASRCELVWNVIVRQVLPRLIDGLRLQIGPAMVYLIAAEFISGDVGFGYRIRMQQKLLDMSVVYPYLATLAGFGFLMDYLLRRLQALFCPWFAKGGR